jgi:hypothetical protein
MIIHSPVGRFPFEATSIRLRGGRLRLEGAMGTWPTSVEVPITELPRVVGRMLPRATTAAAVAAAVVIAVQCGRRRR